MSKRMQILTAAVLLAVMFGMVGARCASAKNGYEAMLSAMQEEQSAKLPHWATVTQNAPVFEGCGMYTRMIGRICVGDAVEVLEVRNGYACVWHRNWLGTPVYVSAEYLSGVR